MTAGSTVALRAAPRLRRRAPIIAAIAIGAAALLPLVLSNYQLSLAIQILIYAVLAMSIDILAGFAGRVSLGHGAIFGAATYVVIYADINAGLSPYLAFLLGIAVATLVAAIFGVLAIRTSGVYFLLLTLALGMIVWGICLRWTAVTGGENGLRGDVRPAIFASHATFFWVVLAFASVLAFAMHRFVVSPFGLTLRGIRDSEQRMRSLGYNVSLHLFIGFTVSGFFAGVAGALYAFFNNFVSPTTVSLSQSVEGLLMTIVGGVGTLFGAFIGAAAVIYLENIVSSYTERWPTILGLTFIAIMIFAPEGILGKLQALQRRRE